jgi:polysaccharide export outer membrane protein
MVHTNKIGAIAVRAKMAGSAKDMVVFGRNKRVFVVVSAVGIALCVLNSGCGDKFFDPTQIGRFRPVPAVNVILDSLGVADEKPSEWTGAEDPKPIDIMVFEDDYTFAPGDVIRVSIFELLQQGGTYINDFVVTETGRISIPEVGIVDVAGLTESQLEEEIRQILSPGILKEPLVTVISLTSERRTYSILGNGVPSPGRFRIPRYDFRLNDALAVSGVAAQFNISYIYVTRTVTGRDVAYGQYEQPSQPPAAEEQIEIPEGEMLEIIAPRAALQRPASRLVITTAEMATEYDDLVDAALPAGFKQERQWIDDNSADEQADVSAGPGIEMEAGRIEWVFRDGKWVPVAVGEPRPRREYPERVEEPRPAERPRAPVPEEFDWEQVGVGGVQTRVIKVPSDKLAGGDARYNIVIRPGDTIHVPLDVIGEFAIMGNVNAQGYINLTGRPMTLKMAIAAAGGLGPLAWPKRCEVTRRVGKNREETVLVDLDKIARGEEPDFFIKPNDLINVGTHPTSRWRAVLRNAFRATYGFGFIYDRNFADREFGVRHPLGPFGFGE